ncbi:MAG: hypothetical protein CMJ76_10545 [Planctomycetaceae bacterium]|nr:hypothetical protein [Planctomycetaceae bacterium]
MADIPKLVLAVWKDHFSRIHWTRLKIIRLSLILLIGGGYFLIGPGTLHEFLTKLGTNFTGYLIATVIAVFIAWYLRKYHNALALYRKDVRKNEKLARGDPDNPAYAIPLASSYRAFAIALTAQNKHAQAAFYNSRADKIEQRLRSFYGELNKLDQ